MDTESEEETSDNDENMNLGPIVAPGEPGTWVVHTENGGIFTININNNTGVIVTTPRITDDDGDVRMVVGDNNDGDVLMVG